MRVFALTPQDAPTRESFLSNPQSSADKGEAYPSGDLLLRPWITVRVPCRATDPPAAPRTSRVAASAPQRAVQASRQKLLGRSKTTSGDRPAWPRSSGAPKATGGTHRGSAYSLSVFRVDQRTGALTQLPGSPFHAGLGVESVAFSPVGGLLAVPSGGHSVSVFSPAALPSHHFTIAHVRTHADGTITFTVHLPGPGGVEALETAHRFVFAQAHAGARRASTIRLSVSPDARPSPGRRSHPPRHATPAGQLHPQAGTLAQDHHPRPDASLEPH